MNPAARHLTGLVLIGAIALTVIAALAVWCSGRSALRHHLSSAEQDEKDHASLPYMTRCTRVYLPGAVQSHLVPPDRGPANYTALCGIAPVNGGSWLGEGSLAEIAVAGALDACPECEHIAAGREKEQQRERGAAS